MKKFTSAVSLGQNWLLRKVPWTKYWVVMTEFCWYVDYANKKWKVIVEKGFVTDMASIPWFLKTIFSPTKFIAPILHDHLMCSEVYNRKEADNILIEALHVENASTFEKLCYYAWVRIGACLWIWKCKTK